MQISQPRPARGKIAVIGAGIIGACIALKLQEEGWQVVLFEAAKIGGPQATSYGNGAFISPASVVPMSLPNLWKKVPGYLMDPLGPLTIRWQYLPRLAPWLLRFLWAGSNRAKVDRTAQILSGLLHDAPERHLALAQKLGAEEMIEKSGLIYVYPDRAAFETEALAWDLRRQNGLSWQEIEGPELHAFEPNLGRRYEFAAYVGTGAYCKDPGLWTQKIAQYAVDQGAEVLHQKVTGFTHNGARLTAIQTADGEIAVDGAVLASGISSGALAKKVGDFVPLVSERGYHVQLPEATGGPSRPVMPSDGKMANTPCSRGLRASGQVELASVEATPDWRRAEILLANLKNTYPKLNYQQVEKWLGHRPSTPDGLPVIGRSKRLHNLLHAFGHGHIGLATAPITAELISQILASRRPVVSLEPFALRW